jgi:hypothetical protein
MKHDVGDWSSMDPDGALDGPASLAPMPQVLILTPLKDASQHFPGYVERLRALTYPHDQISIGLLKSDSVDGTFEVGQRHLPFLAAEFRKVRIWKHDYGYQIPEHLPRWHGAIQPERRSVLARSRNHLLFRALDDEEWVLWLDVDVIEFAPDLIERLLATGRSIVHPHCVRDYGGPTFDLNAWRDRGRLHLEDLRGEGTFTELHAVGGTVLWVLADLHRDGLIFPPVPYGRRSAYARTSRGELETEGLGLMAMDMGHTPWGMPHFEVIHHPD